jgi:hypothetical protein
MLLTPDLDHFIPQAQNAIYKCEYSTIAISTLAGSKLFKKTEVTRTVTSVWQVWKYMWLLTTAEQSHAADHNGNTEDRNQAKDQHGRHGQSATARCWDGARRALWSACPHHNGHTNIHGGFVSGLKPGSILRAHGSHGQHSDSRENENKDNDAF